MNIGITTFGCDLKSGMSRYISNLLTHFSTLATGDTIHVLAHPSAASEYMEEAVHGALHSVGIPELLSNPLLNIAWHQSALQYRAMRDQYDVLFLPAASRRTPMWSPCPTVGTIHDLTPFHVPDKYDAFRSFYQTKVLTRMLRRLTHIIAISESTKRDIQQFIGIPEERITVIHHAADTRTFYPRDKQESIRALGGYGIRAPYIVYTSRIEHPGKNHVRLIQAFEHLKAKEDIPHQLVLAGADWHGAEEVHRLARASRFSDDIILTGFVRSGDLPLLYCGADLMAFPSLFEGFGLPILEAMASGVPVACSNVSSLPEITGEAAILFEPLNVDSMASGMRTILTNDETVRHYARLGIARAAEFSWAKTAAQTLETLHTVANQ